MPAPSPRVGFRFSAIRGHSLPPSFFPILPGIRIISRPLQLPADPPSPPSSYSSMLLTLTSPTPSLHTWPPAQRIPIPSHLYSDSLFDTKPHPWPPSALHRRFGPRCLRRRHLQRHPRPLWPPPRRRRRRRAQAGDAAGSPADGRRAAAAAEPGARGGAAGLPRAVLAGEYRRRGGTGWRDTGGEAGAEHGGHIEYRRGRGVYWAGRGSSGVGELRVRVMCWHSGRG